MADDIDSELKSAMAELGRRGWSGFKTKADRQREVLRRIRGGKSPTVIAGGGECEGKYAMPRGEDSRNNQCLACGKARSKHPENLR